MAKVFVSYSRRDIEFAKRLTTELHKNKLDFWIDWEGIPPTVDWWQEIEKGIEEADVFLFLISPDSAKSKVCGQEIDTAIKNAKRIIPLIVRQLNADEAPQQLSHLNWIFFRENDDFNVALQNLMTAIQTDYEWVATHRRLQVRALEWERKNKDNSFLLRGSDLHEAELQLARNTSKEPHPTDLQREYVFASRKAADRQRGITTAVSIAAGIALAALAIWGWGQAGLATRNANESRKNASTAQAASTLAFNNAGTAIANEQLAQVASTLASNNATISRAGELAARSEAIREENFPVSLLLAIEGFKLKDTAPSQGALLDNTYANQNLFKYLLINHSIVTSVAFSPNGTILASAGMDGAIHILNTKQYTEIKSFAAHTEEITKLEFSPDGTLLASASKDGTIRLWDTIKYQVVGQPLRGQEGAITSLAFSPDGNVLSSGSDDLSVILWDAKSQTLTDSQMKGSDKITDVAFSPNGETLAAAAGNKIITWKTQNYSSNTFSVDSAVYDIAFQPNSNVLAIATCGRTGSNGFCNQGKIIFYDIVSQQTIDQPLIGHGDYVRRIAFSPDGKILASGSWDKTILLWDTETHLTLTRSFYGHTSFVNSLAFSPDGKSFVSGGGDETVIIWNIDQQQTIGEQYQLDHEVASLAATKDGKRFATGSNIGVVELWDRNMDPATSTSLIGHAPTFVNGAAFSPDAKILATGSHDKTIRLWDVATGQPIGDPLQGHTDLVVTVAFSPNGKILASGSWDNNVILWDVSNPVKPINIGTLEGKAEVVNRVAFSPDGKILAAAYMGKSLPNDLHENPVIILWDVATQQQIGAPLTGHTDSVNDVVFSPDGKYLYSASYDKTIIQWDVATHKNIGQFIGHTDLVYTVAVRSDGKMLASGGSDKQVILWNVATHQPIEQPLGLHNAAVNSAAFIDDDRTLVTSSVDGTVIFWSLDPQIWIQKTCERVGRNFTYSEWTLYFHPDEVFHKTCPQWDLESPPAATPQP